MRAVLVALLLWPAADNLVDKRLGDFATADDATFLRRASLDLAGETPEPQSVRDFLADTTDDKRARKIDELLASKAFRVFWSRRLSAWWLGYPRDNDFLVNHNGFTRWIETRLDAGASYADLVRDVLTASGQPQSKAVASFLYRFAFFDDAGGYGVRIDELTGAVGQTFLGIRLRCAQCHDHPTDRWTQDHFYGVTAFFRGTGLRTSDFGVADLKKPPKYAFERYASTLEPKYLDGAAPGTEPLRAELGRLLTADKQFARAAVNRIWASFFGKGLVDPFDDFTPSRTSPPLLEDLADLFVASSHDLRAVMRVIANSQAYQRKDAPVRPLAPEQHYGALARATLLDQATLDTKAIRRGASPLQAYQSARVVLRTTFISMLARTSEADSPAALHRYTADAQQVLRMLDVKAPIYTGARRGTNGRLDAALASRDAVEEIYLAAVSRYPTQREYGRALAQIVRRKNDGAAAIEALFWALLNSDEFLFNH